MATPSLHHPILWGFEKFSVFEFSFRISSKTIKDREYLKQHLYFGSFSPAQNENLPKPKIFSEGMNISVWKHKKTQTSRRIALFLWVSERVHKVFCEPGANAKTGSRMISITKQVSGVRSGASGGHRMIYCPAEKVQACKWLTWKSQGSTISDNTILDEQTTRQRCMAKPS